MEGGSKRDGQPCEGGLENLQNGRGKSSGLARVDQGQ
jgi:hypothetical protein